MPQDEKIWRALALNFDTSLLSGDAGLPLGVLSLVSPSCEIQGQQRQRARTAETD